MRIAVRAVSLLVAENVTHTTRRCVVTDDIVKYLRLSQTRFNRHAEAADEIENLRAELEEFKRQYRILKQIAKDDHLAMCKLNDHELCVSYLEWKIKKEVSNES